MTADDGTQARTIEAIEAEMARQGVKNTEIARALGMSASQWGNVKNGDQVLAPWMQRKIAIRLGSAACVVGEVVAATGESLERLDAAPAVDTLGAAVSLVSEAADVPRAILDGTRTREGRERALRELDEVQAKLDALRAALMTRAA
jgi:hypothetical protein